jgi:hypothetical protein
MVNYTPQQQRGISNRIAFDFLLERGDLARYFGGNNLALNTLSAQKYHAFRSWNFEERLVSSKEISSFFLEYAKRLEKEGLLHLREELITQEQIMLEGEQEDSLDPKNLGELIDWACREKTLEGCSAIEEQGDE